MYKNAGGRTSRANKGFEGQRNMVATTPRMAKLPKKANNKIEQSSDATFRAAAKKNFEGNPGLAAKLAKLRSKQLASARVAQRQKQEAHKMRAEKKAKKRAAKLTKQQNARAGRTDRRGAAQR